MCSFVQVCTRPQLVYLHDVKYLRWVGYWTWGLPEPFSVNPERDWNQQTIKSRVSHKNKKKTFSIPFEMRETAGEDETMKTGKILSCRAERHSTSALTVLTADVIVIQMTTETKRRGGKMSIS